MSITGTGINHFAISVRNLEETIDWYEEVLGFRLIVKDRIPDIGVRTAHMMGYGIVLECFEAENAVPLPSYRRHPNEDLRVHGNKHFSISVADRNVAMKELEEMGIDVIMTADVWNTYGIFICDPTGNLIELFEGDMRNYIV